MSNNLSDLWSRLKIVFIVLIVYRIGVHIPLPDINLEQLAQLFHDNSDTILSLFNMFSGGALENMSILALGIMPYISASIIMQLMTAISPSLEKLKKDGESGLRKINQYTRYLTVTIALLQAIGLSVGLVNQKIALSSDVTFYLVVTTTLVSGAVFLMWLGEQITERGIGNGISILIFVSIVSGLPGAIGQALEQTRQGETSFLFLFALLFVAIALLIFVVFMERGQRRITLNYARSQARGSFVSNHQSHLPLKINMAGVIPPIFASSILLFPASMGKWFGEESNMIWIQELSIALSPGGALYISLFACAVMFFCFFYTALVFNPKDMASNLKKSGALISGIRPGQQSANYIDSVATRLTLFGGLYITLVSLLPQFFIMQWNIPFYLGGTSILIVVVVVMDFMTQIQSYIFSHQYSNFMDKNSLKNK